MLKCILALIVKLYFNFVKTELVPPCFPLHIAATKCAMGSDVEIFYTLKIGVYP